MAVKVSVSYVQILGLFQRIENKSSERFSKVTAIHIRERCGLRLTANHWQRVRVLRDLPVSEPASEGSQAPVSQ